MTHPNQAQPGTLPNGLHRPLPPQQRFFFLRPRHTQSIHYTRPLSSRKTTTKTPPPHIPGTYSLEGALECSPCPSGFYSGPRASVCIPCEVGTYRQQDSASGYCYDCEAGTYAPFEQASECMVCPRGYYSAARSTECLPCPTGTAGDGVGSGDACETCSAGEYSSEAGSTVCEKCPAGTASAAVQANSNVCQVGHRG